MPLDCVESAGEVATARETTRIAAGVLEAGTVAAQRMAVSGIRHGRPVLRFIATWYCTTGLDPAWDVRATGWHVLVDGDAPLDIDLRFPVLIDRMGQMSPATPPNRAVNAVPIVCAAPPGIRTTTDLPQIVVRLG
jgi:2,4-diaminopentanoate dehydrogenase